MSKYEKIEGLLYLMMILVSLWVIANPMRPERTGLSLSSIEDIVLDSTGYKISYFTDIENEDKIDVYTSFEEGDKIIEFLAEYDSLVYSQDFDSAIEYEKQIYNITKVKYINNEWFKGYIVLVL